MSGTDKVEMIDTITSWFEHDGSWVTLGKYSTDLLFILDRCRVANASHAPDDTHLCPPPLPPSLPAG